MARGDYVLLGLVGSLLLAVGLLGCSTLDAVGSQRLEEASSELGLGVTYHRSRKQRCDLLNGGHDVSEVDWFDCMGVGYR